MNFKKRMISLLIAVLLLFNSIPVGRASVGNLSIVGADTVGAENALKAAVTDMTYGWDGKTYQFPSDILATVAEDHEVYLVADTAVEGHDERAGIPKVGEEAVDVTFTNFRLAGADAAQYTLTELADLVSFTEKVKILPKTLWITPAVTKVYYGQDLPELGEVDVSDKYKEQLVSEQDRVTVSCTFTFELNGAVDVGVYELVEVSEILLLGPDAHNYRAEIENQDNLEFRIDIYETDAIPSDDGANNIHNGKTEAVLEAPDGFKISLTGDLDDEDAWHEEVTIALDETEADKPKVVTYYLRNNNGESDEYKAVCQKTYSYIAMPMPTVTGMELVKLFTDKVVDGVTTSYETMVVDKDDAVYANGNMQVVVYVRGATYEQETEIFLSVNGAETGKPAEEVILENGRYIYKAAFDITSVDGENVPHELKAYAKNSSGTGEVYPAENCQDTYMGYRTPVTQHLVLDRKGPGVDIQKIDSDYSLDKGFRIWAEFTITDEEPCSDIVEVKYLWDDAGEFKKFTEYQNNQTEYTLQKAWDEGKLRLDGKHSLTLIAEDELGNVTRVTYTAEEGADYLDPVIKSVEITHEEGVMLQDTADGILANGTVTLVIRAEDAVGENSATSGLKDDAVTVASMNGQPRTATKTEDGVYVLVINPNEKLTDISISVKDASGRTVSQSLNKIPIHQAESGEGEEGSTGVSYYKSNKLHVENVKPSISITKLGVKYSNDDNGIYWVGAADVKNNKIAIVVTDEPGGVFSGVKCVTVFKSKDGVSEKISGMSVALAGEKSCAPSEIDVSSWEDGIWTITVEAKDFCGNTHTELYTFKKDVKEPETGDIDLDQSDPDFVADVETLDGAVWFAPEISVETGKDGHLSFRIGTDSKDEKLSKIILKFNGEDKGSREYTLNGQKYKLKDDPNGGSYIEISTSDSAFELKVPGDDEDFKSHYEVTAVFVDLAGNPTEQKTKIVYVDRVNPNIKKVTVQKADESLVHQIIRILTFGIFSNDDLIFNVYTYDGKGDSGMKRVDMTVTDKDTGEAVVHSTESSEVDEEGFVIYSFTVSKGELEKFDGSLAFTAYDRYGKDCTSYPYIDINENFEVMIERELPGITFDLPEATGFYQEREDGQIWYNADKPLSLQVHDTHSGIYSITLLVNGTKKDLFSNPEGIVKDRLFAPEKENETEVNDFDRYFTLFNLEKAVNDNAVPGKNGEYRLAVKVADNSGNVYAIERAYYIDTVKPTVDKISFSTVTADDVLEITGDDIFSAAEPVQYSYFFQENFDITVHVSDPGPSSGLHHVDYWFHNAVGEAKTAQITDGKALIDVDDNFKGMIYYRVWDAAGNCSDVMTTNAFVVDSAAPTIDIQYDGVTTNYKDAVGNPLYTQTKTFTVTITDTVSGLKQFSYLKNAELDPAGSSEITIDKDGTYTVDGKLPGEWKIAAMDANLVTKVTRTFSFAEDDNDIQMFFNAMDQATNKVTNVSSSVFTIDTKAPQIRVDFGSDNDDDPYYNQNRIATITVAERNFSESLIRVMIENLFGDVPGYTFTHDSNDNTKHTATINFDEGDYTFNVEGEDLGGHKAVVTYAGGNERLFYVDKTVPVIMENFYEFANEKENSFNTDKTARITIVEHNFDPNLTNLRITRKAAGGEHSHNGMVDVTNEILGGRTWSRNVDTYTISFTFSEDAIYYVEIAPVDLASNRGAKHNTVIFEIDKTVPVVSAKNGNAVAPDATELLDIYPYDRRNDAVPTVDFADNNIASIEYTLITYIPKYLNDGLTVVEPVIKRGTIQGSRFTLEDFTRDGIYSVELVAVDIAGNRSEINYNTYARMVNQDVLAFILDSNVKEQTGLFSLEYEDGEAISKKPNDFMDLRILVMTPADTSMDIVLRDTNGKETLTTAGLVSLERVYGVNVHTFALSADFFRENFQDDIDTEMHLTVRNKGGRIDLARIHIDNIKPACDVPEELSKWAWFFGEEDRMFTITNISEKLEEADCRVYDNGEVIPFVYSSEDDTLSFTLSEGWHNIGFILSDAAGNANIGQEVANIHIGYFWAYFIAAGVTVLVAVAVATYLYRRKRILREMQEEE